MVEVFSPLMTSENPNTMNSSDPSLRTKIDRIIIHHNDALNKDVAMNTWLKGGAAQTSAHYEITPTEIIGCVGENYIAWHSGDWNMNTRSIGLEHLNETLAPDFKVADATLNNSARLIADICKRYSIPIDRQHILGHKEVIATACPGGINVDDLVARAQKYSNGSNTAPSTPTPVPAGNNTIIEGDFEMKLVEITTDGTYFSDKMNYPKGAIFWVSGDRNFGHIADLTHLQPFVKMYGQPVQMTASDFLMVIQNANLTLKVR